MTINKIHLTIFNSLCLIILLVSFASCADDKEDYYISECDRFVSALFTYDYAYLAQEIDRVCSDLSPHPSSEDQTGHMNNLDILADRIGKCESIDAEISPVFIFTNPPQAEIILTIDSLWVDITRVIDILIPENSHLKYNAIHR